MEIQGYQDYRPYLRSELERRLSLNPRYSLRAFARDLRMAPQILSGVLNGKKGISVEAAARIAERLSLSPEESSYLLDLVTLVHARSAQAKKIAAYKLKERHSTTQYRSLEMEAFRAISDWYHYGIIELMNTADFQPDPQWIAARLGISTFEVEQAIERLVQLQLIERQTDGSLKRTEVNLSANYGVPSEAIRKFTKQILQKAQDSLESQSLDERDLTTMTMAIDPTLLPVAKKRIAEFRRELAALLEQDNRTEVYVFAPSLFKLSKSRSLKGNKK